MSEYKIIDNGQESYIIEAENAKGAILKWIEIYSSSDVLEFIAENGYEYIARLQIIKYS